MKLLNAGNHKTAKGEALGFKTYGLHLSPSDKSGYNTCKWASKGCRAACLDTAGRGNMSNVQSARVNKTRFFFEHREEFLSQLLKEINGAIRSAERQGFTPCFRLNLTSDIAWESVEIKGKTLFDIFPDVIFYDYSKSFDRCKASRVSKSWPNNYHLTYSRSERTHPFVIDSLLALGCNVAVVFRGELAKSYRGHRVIDGDLTDLRFRDAQGVIVGLVAKGLGKRDESGFVLEAKEVTC